MLRLPFFYSLIPIRHERTPSYLRSTQSSRNKFYTSLVESSEASSEGETSGVENTPRAIRVTQSEPINIPPSLDEPTPISPSREPPLLDELVPIPPSRNESTPPSRNEPTLPTPTQAKPDLSMEGILESIPGFYGRKDSLEDPVEYLETLEFVVNEKYV